MATDKPTAYSYIRFSTPEQLKGDSLRRQVELSEDYAKKHGLNLDKSLSIKDLGVSAYDSSNLSKGALGVFLQAVKDKRVPQGSYLLIESLDRLSRAQVLTALKIFTSILDEGIVICTLTDGMQYSSESVGKNFSELLISLTIMARAHEESKTKSVRLSAAWKEKRKNLADKKFTAQCPSWMMLDKTKNEFVLIQAQVNAVKHIFNLAASGLGNYSIVKRLNSEGIRNHGRSQVWSTSTIQKILNNRAVLGEFQAHTLVNRKSVPDGEPVSGYYPAIIDESLFYRVQESRKGKLANSSAGAKGARYSNLFSGFCKCAYCGGPMNYYNKGGRRKTADRWKYLACTNGKRGLGCATTHVQYANFELNFLEDLAELDLSAVMDTDNDSKITGLQSEHDITSGQLDDTQSKLTKLTDMMLESDVPRTFIAKAAELEALQDKLSAKLKSLQAEIAAIGSLHRTAESRVAELKALSAAMSTSEGDDLYELRSRLVQAVRSVVDNVYLYPDGDPKNKVTHGFYMIKFKNEGIRYIKMRDESAERRFKLLLEKVAPPSYVDKFKDTKSSGTNVPI